MSVTCPNCGHEFETRLRPSTGGGRRFNASTRLGQMMQRRGMTVGDLAAQSGYSERYISNWLAGRTAPRPENYIALARALKCPVAAIDHTE